MEHSGLRLKLPFSTSLVVEYRKRRHTFRRIRVMLASSCLWTQKRKELWVNFGSLTTLWKRNISVSLLPIR